VEVVNDNVGESQFLLLTALLEAALHDAAAVLVRADLDARLDAGIEDELCEAFIVLAALLIRLFWVL